MARIDISFRKSCLLRIDMYNPPSMTDELCLRTSISPIRLTDCHRAGSHQFLLPCNQRLYRCISCNYRTSFADQCHIFCILRNPYKFLIHQARRFLSCSERPPPLTIYERIIFFSGSDCKRKDCGWDSGILYIWRRGPSVWQRADVLRECAGKERVWPATVSNRQSIQLLSPF